jgi:RNA polymerase sigma-70 factor (ECF subfamily)
LETQIDFQTIYQEYKDKVYTIAFRYLPNRQNALDVSQDVFIKIFEDIGKLPLARELGPYIYRMTVNRCIDILRKIVPLRLSEDYRETPQPCTPQADQDDEVDFLLSNLNPDQKMAVILKEILGFSVDETATACSVDSGTVKSRLSRAREAMRKTLARRSSIESGA